MTRKNYFIGVDVGTQGVRCGIMDQYGEIIAVNETGYKIFFPQPGYATQKPADWLDSFDASLKDCLNHVDGEIARGIKGISVCATASTVIAVDKNGNALSDAILWMDNRAKAEAEEINASRHEALKYCGGEVSVEWLIPKILWMKRNKAEIYRNSDRLVEQLDFFNHYLTGKWVASICQATCKGNYLDDREGLTEDYYKQIGLDDYREKINTQILKLGEKIGMVRPEIANKFGLPENTPVYQGGIDAHISMLGLGVCRPGDAGMIMGTSFVYLALSETPVYSNGIWGPYFDAVIPGLYCLEGGQVSAGSITKWFLNEFSIKGEEPYLLMAEEAKNVPIGSKGVITLDFFQGNRTPYKDPNAKGVFYGLTLNHNRADIYRSIMEGIAFGSRNIIDTISSNNVQINSIMVCGGVTKNPLWLKIIADVTGKPITLTKNSANSGILGCAILGAVGSGLYNNFEEAVDAMVQCTDTVYPYQKAHGEYNQFYNKYLKLYDNLKELMSE
jgi:FGGY-family pentulose kinase